MMRYATQASSIRPACVRAISLLAVLLSLLAPAGVFAQSEKIFSDTEFDFESDWSLYGPYIIPADAPNGGFTAEQSLVNGHPGAHLSVTMTRPTVGLGQASAVWGAVINDTLSWDPAESADGPLGRLDLLIDARDGGAWTLAVEQDGYVWLALTRRKFGTNGAWVTLSITCLEEIDFVPLPGSEFVVDDQPEHPDFSATGSPIAFGIGAGLSCPTTSNCTVLAPTTFGLDNLQVSARQPMRINAGLNDAWYEPAKNGQGIFHIVFPEIERIFLAWFTYDTERPPEDVVAVLGEPGHRWLTAQGAFSGDTAVLELYLSEGGIFDSSEVLPEPAVSVGTMTIEWCSCTRGRFSYDLPGLGLHNTLELQRITPDNVALCEALQAQ